MVFRPVLPTLNLAMFSHGTCGRNEGNPIDADFIVIDEASMIDIDLASKLLRAVPDHAAICFVGDVDQLPPVGAGALLTSLIDSGVVPVFRLLEIHRQQHGSQIIKVSQQLNSGEMPVVSTVLGEGDFVLLEEKPEHVATRVRQLVERDIPLLLDCDPFEDVHVLCPMKSRGSCSSQSLNARLQLARWQMNNVSPAKAVHSRQGVFAVGDKVMQTVNNTSRDVYNGEIGVVVAVRRSGGQEVMEVDFDDRCTSYTLEEIDEELMLAYAFTVHKAQGCEVQRDPFLLADNLRTQSCRPDWLWLA